MHLWRKILGFIHLPANLKWCNSSLSLFMDVILCSELNILLDWIHWTFGNVTRPFFWCYQSMNYCGPFLVSWCCLFVCLLMVCIFEDIEALNKSSIFVNVTTIFVRVLWTSGGLRCFIGELPKHCNRLFDCGVCCWLVVSWNGLQESNHKNLNFPTVCGSTHLNRSYSCRVAVLLLLCYCRFHTFHTIRTVKLRYSF